MPYGKGTYKKRGRPSKKKKTMFKPTKRKKK